MSTQWFQAGDYVLTPDGPGIVQYWRWDPPTNNSIGTYTVKLESKTGQSGYEGDTYPADRIMPHGE